MRPKTIAARASARTPAKRGGKRTSPRLPHENEVPGSEQIPPPQPIMEQARQDIEAGLQDTDRHAMPGLEKPEKWREP